VSFCVDTSEFLNQGFLNTAAPFYADAILLLECAMAVLLLLGAFLARKRKYRWHACCQSSIVLLNLLVISAVMVPSFTTRIAPKLPARMHKAYYLLASVHATLGGLAEFLGLYILIAAGTKLLPARLAFTDYKIWMRTALVLWWASVLLGIATYARWYIP
jgi:uncharacterized membrane protein YozB (DUF420 family)